MSQLYKLQTLTCSVCMAALAMTASAAADTAPASLNAAQSSTPEWKVLLNEDFSKFTGGTEANIGDPIEMVDSYYLPDSYTSTPGWMGGGLYAVDGTCYIGYRTSGGGQSVPGYLSTPEQTIRGIANVSFRAKSADGYDSSVWVSMIESSAGPREGSQTFTLTHEWETYTFTSDKGSLTEGSWIQFQAKNGAMLIDDIRIDYLHDRIATPYCTEPTNHSTTEFTANWNATDADGYMFNLFRLEPEANPAKGTLFENWDNLNVNEKDMTIDKANPGWSEGWEITLQNLDKKGEVGFTAAAVSSEKYSLRFGTPGDMITSPVMPATISEVNVWIKPSKVDSPSADRVSFFSVRIWHEYTQTWDLIAQIPSYWLPSGGGKMTFKSDCFREDGTRIRFEMVERGSGFLYFDDISIAYASPGKRVDVITDAYTTENKYKVSDIDPDMHYFYYVYAQDQDGVRSQNSIISWVNGVTELTVDPLPADRISLNGYTAHWTPLPHATSYAVETSRFVDANKVLADSQGTSYPVTIIEEFFDRVTTDQRNDPESFYDFGHNMMAHSHWTATNACWNAEAIASAGDMVGGQAGVVCSPVFHFNGDTNRDFNIQAKIYNTVASYGRNKPEYLYFFMVPGDLDITSPYLTLNAIRTAALGECEILTDIIETHDVDVTLTARADADLSSVKFILTSKSGKAFWLDDFILYKNVNAGESFQTPSDILRTQDTSYKVESLDPLFEYGYQVMPITHRAFKDYFGVLSDMQRVTLTDNSSSAAAISGSALSVEALSGCIRITGLTEGTHVSLYDASGALSARTVAYADTLTLPVASGLHIVSVGKECFKVIVK